MARSPSGHLSSPPLPGTRRLWRYTGLEEVQPGDTVIWRGRSFRVRSSREHALSDEINHWWALLEPERRAAE